jgi:DNA-binding MarR family transcriptional regulator
MTKRRYITRPKGGVKIDFFRQTHRDSEKDIDFGIWALLNQSRDAVLRVRENELSQYGITAKEADALLNIINNDNVTPAEISRILFREHNTVSALLTRMEKKGLIVKARDKQKKNIWRIKITENGRNAYLNSIKRESLHKIISTFSADEKKQLFSFLKEIRENALSLLVSAPTIPFPW